MRKSKLRLGEILIKEGVIGKHQLDEALRYQRLSDRPLGDIVVDRGFCRESDVSNALAKQLDIPHVSLADGSLLPSLKEDKAEEMMRLIPEPFARQHMALALSKHQKSLTVAFANPLDLLTIDNLRKITGNDINPVIATKSDIREAISKFYGRRDKDMLAEAVDDTYKAEDGLVVESNIPRDSLEDVVAKAEEAPVVKLVDLMMIQAVKERASDIHIEPFRHNITVRYRIDGALHKIAPPSQHLLPALISRVKILSKMDISEKRLPQDGGFTVKIQDRLIDVRVSILPTIFGEKAVLRILDKGSIAFELDKLGFLDHDLENFKKAIVKPYGFVLITGPTGSGKSTTLYGALNFIKSPKKNIITIEDPVEYNIGGINQVQVKPKIGLTFAEGLRSFLRQDPDIIMVGEIRDMETAEMCVRAALTGHMVFSTLHTNDAPSTISRLIDIGVEPYLISACMTIVVAQRLVRKLCAKCKEPVMPPENITKLYNLPRREVFKARGCEHCRQTGYSGRTSIHEAMVINDEIRQLISKGSDIGTLKRAAVRLGMKSLAANGMEKVLKGITSIEEVLSVAIE